MQNTTSDGNKNSTAPRISTICHIFVWCWIYSTRRVQSEVAPALHGFIWWYSSMSAPLSFPYISRWCDITSTSVHLLLLSPPFPSCSPYSLPPISSPLSPPSVFPPTCLLLSFLPFSHWRPHLFPPRLSLPPSLPNSLCPLSARALSLSLRRALMNCLPLPVNSTDNPGEAVKDHRSALQTGPQATAHEQHPNNKPLHLALGIHVCMYMHVCVHACLWAW